MNNQFLGLLLVGIAFLTIGFLMSTKESVAAWGLKGRARIWVTLLGQERAMKLTRYFFGPLGLNDHAERVHDRAAAG